MKKLLLLTLTAIALVLGSCSTDDSTTEFALEQQQTVTDTTWYPTNYKLLITNNSVPIENVHLSVKRNNEDWRQMEIIDNAIQIQRGDSLHITTSTYVAGEINKVKFQIFNYKNEVDDFNLTREYIAYDKPVDNKIMIDYFQVFNGVR